jgi:hypothetical protein
MTRPLPISRPARPKLMPFSSFLAWPTSACRIASGLFRQVDGERAEPDADHVPVGACPLEQRQRVAAELQGVPEQPPSARYFGYAGDCLGCGGHLRRLSRSPASRMRHANRRSRPAGDHEADAERTGSFRIS